MISATKWLPLRIPLALVPSRAASIQQVASSRTSAAIAPARTRPKREGARGGRGAEKVGRAVGRGHAAARARQGAHGRAGHGEAPATDADSGPTRSHRGRPVSAVDARTVVGAARRAAGAAERRGAAAAARGLQRRGPARPSRGRAWAAVTRRVACVRSARSAHGPKTLALRARGARARGKKRRAGVLGRRRRPRRENCVRKGGAVPLLGAIPQAHGLVSSDDKRNRLITKEEIDKSLEIEDGGPVSGPHHSAWRSAWRPGFRPGRPRRAPGL